MKTKSRFPLRLAIAVGAAPWIATADLGSSFDAGTEAWRASEATAVLTWQSTDGNPAGHLRATGPNAPWHLLSPAAWAGDWSAYRTMKFDLGLPSGHYPATDFAGIVTIAGTNGLTMTWHGPTPLWTWTYYEVSLDPASFATDSTTFQSIMASVSEVRILAEFATATETVALDNVILTTAPPVSFSTNLTSTFNDGSNEGWSVVDDANLSVQNEGRPSWSLSGNDSQAGQYFKVCSPPSWAGDWSAFSEIRFDMKWVNANAPQPSGPILTLFGASGDKLECYITPVADAWVRHVIALTPASFQTDAATLARVLSHVSKVWLHGEFGPGDDQARFDNITVATGPHAPAVRNTSLSSRFGSGTDGWLGYDNILTSWDPVGGFLDSGALKGVDQGTGSARFQSPDSWAGDWRAFRSLRLLLFQNIASDSNAEIWIANYQGQTLTQSLAKPLRLWSPYTFDLTPNAFAVDQSTFDAVMADVACLWIRSDLDSSYDTTWLDDVSLATDDSPPANPPDRAATFDSNPDGWTRGNLSADTWAQPAAVHNFHSTQGNPPGCIANNDSGTGTTTWYSPEAWTGDWRGYRSVFCDLRILTGNLANLVPVPINALWLASPRGTLAAQFTEAPSNTAWKRYRIDLTPATFGVSQSELDLILRDVSMLSIRSEWLSSTAESEALDNVLVTSASETYWTWLADFLSATDLANPSLAAPSADFDRDSCSNWTEFLALTSPADGSRRFTLDPPTPAPGGLDLRFLARTGRVYQLRVTNDLAAPRPWPALGAPVTGDDSVHQRTDASVGPRRFYQLEITLPP